MSKTDGILTENSAKMDCEAGKDKIPDDNPGTTDQLLPTDEKGESEVKAKSLSQILTVLVVSFGCFIHGTSIVFPAVSLPQMVDDSNLTTVNRTNREYIGYYINPDTDVPWIVSNAAIGTFFGCLLAAPSSNIIGRRLTCLLGIGVTYGLAYLMVVVAIHVLMLYLSRFLMGFGLGVSLTISTLYIQDVATPNIRGTLGAVPGVLGCLGVNTYQILGAFVEWKTINILCGFLTLPFILLLFCIPESPVYLVSRGKLKEAAKSLVTLRGVKWNTEKEIEEIKSRLDLAEGSRKTISLSTLKSPQVLKPLLIGITLMLLMNLSGINWIMQYTVQIFQTANSSINPFLATVYVGMALLASNISTVLLAHKLPRRLLLLASSFGLALTLAIMGVSYQLTSWEKDCVAEAIQSDLNLFPNQTMENSQVLADLCSYGNLGWLPLADLMVFIFVFNLGYGAMIWITVMELQPCHVREFCNSLCVAFMCPVSFLTTYTYPSLMKMVGGHGTCWIYSAFSLAGFVFIFFCVPETRGKTEEEIQAYFTPGVKQENQAENKSEA